MYFADADARVLVLCAHPDDEIGCGAFIKKLIEQGQIVHYAYFSDCAESTRSLGFEPKELIKECYESCYQLGIQHEHITGFNFPVRHFPKFRQEILETLIELSKKIKPSIVLVASRYDVHQDHQTLTQEAIRAFKHSTILGYEFPWNHMESNLSVLVRIEQRHIDAKIRAWSCYKTQAARAYHGQQVLESLARVRGIQANSQFAESYEAIRVFY